MLLDLNLRDMRGEDVLQRLRGASETADVPVVILSADSTSRDINRLLHTAADAYLTKPVDVGRLVSVLDRFLGRR